MKSKLPTVKSVVTVGKNHALHESYITGTPHKFALLQVGDFFLSRRSPKFPELETKGRMFLMIKFSKHQSYGLGFFQKDLSTGIWDLHLYDKPLQVTDQQLLDSKTFHTFYTMLAPCPKFGFAKSRVSRSPLPGDIIGISYDEEGNEGKKSNYSVVVGPSTFIDIGSNETARVKMNDWDKTEIYAIVSVGGVYIKFSGNPCSEVEVTVAPKSKASKLNPLKQNPPVGLLNFKIPHFKAWLRENVFMADLANMDAGRLFMSKNTHNGVQLQPEECYVYVKYSNALIYHVGHVESRDDTATVYYGRPIRVMRNQIKNPSDFYANLLCLPEFPSVFRKSTETHLVELKPGTYFHYQNELDIEQEEPLLGLIIDNYSMICVSHAHPKLIKTLGGNTKVRPAMLYWPIPDELAPKKVAVQEEEVPFVMEFTHKGRAPKTHLFKDLKVGSYFAVPYKANDLSKTTFAWLKVSRNKAVVVARNECRDQQNEVERPDPKLLVVKLEFQNYHYTHHAGNWISTTYSELSVGDHFRLSHETFALRALLKKEKVLYCDVPAVYEPEFNSTDNVMVLQPNSVTFKLESGE